MPIMEGCFGTDANGNPEKDYCTFCYQNGSFTDPNLTLDGMIEKSVHHMTTSMKMPKGHAMEMSHSVIPFLKRWITSD